MQDKVNVNGRAQRRVLCPDVTLLLLENPGCIFNLRGRTDNRIRFPRLVASGIDIV
jgi:hypothetical protein